MQIMRSIGGKLRTDERDDAEEEKKARRSGKKIVDGRIEDNNGGDKRGEEKLSRENPIDLADETPSELILAVA